MRKLLVNIVENVGQLQVKLVLCFLVLISSLGHAQLDTEHYLPPLTSSTHRFIGGAGAGFQVIYLSTPSVDPVNYTIYDGAGAILYSGTVRNANPVSHGGEGAGAMTGLNTPLFVNQANLNQVLTGRGVKVVADAPVYCNLRVRSPNNAQAASITAKGKNALGTVFRLGHITTPQKASNWGLQSLGSKLATVGFHATEDNTVITVDLSKVNPKLWGANAPNAGAPFTITLNKGESYVMALRNQDAPNRNAGAGFSGGLVTSTKPIVVNCASMGGYASNTWQADFGADQIVPYEKVGTKYAVVRGASNDNALEKVMIVAHENGTEVKVNGQVVCGNLAAGALCNINGSKYQNGGMYIETSKPTFAYQFIMGHGGGEKKTPGMNFLPPISCETSSYVDNIPLVHKIGDVNYKGTINIVTTKTGADLEVFVNGVKRNNLGAARNIPNSDYQFYKISDLSGNLAVKSKTIALVSFTGYNGAAGFGGFFSGWKEETITDSANCLPGYLFEPVPKSGTYRWFKDGIEIPGETNDSLFATESGNYTFERTNAGCKDTSEVMVAAALNEFSFDGDTAFCPGDSVQLSIVGQGFDSLAWETGEQSNSIWINAEGTTYLRVYSDVLKECYVDTFVTTVKSPSPAVTLLDTTFCDGGSVTLDAGNPGMGYEWSTGATTQTIDVSQTGDYWVKVTDGGTACAGLDTAQIVVQGCNTDVQVTKTDNRDKYLPGTGTQYTIVAKNNGPTDVQGATVVDPIPAGVNAGDVTWSAVAHGGATTQSNGVATGALNDVVNLPVGDSVVYTVKLVTPETFLGDLVNVVTITADRDTFPDNNVATDTDTVDCSFAVSGTVNSRLAAWQQIGPVINGLSYNIINGGGSKNFTPTNGPEKDNLITTVIYNSGTGNHISLTRNRYRPNDNWFNTITGLYDNTPHGWTGLSGTGGETAPILGFMAFVDQNGNGRFDSGVEEYIRDVAQLTLTPTTSGELYMAFYDDGVYTDNGGIITIEASLDPPVNNGGPKDFRICAGESVEFDAGNPSAIRWDWNTGASTQKIQADSTGQYISTVTTFGGCNTKDTMNLIVDTVDVTLRPDTAFCDGGSVLLDAGNITNLAVEWTGGSSTQTLTADTTGLYKVVVNNSFGCSDSDSVNVVVNPLPVVSLRNDTAFCEGPVIDLDAENPGATYEWSTGESTQTIAIDTAGQYRVLVTDGNGCEGRDTMNLVVHPYPDVTLREDTAVCFGESVLIEGGNTPNLILKWTGGASTQSIRADTTGLYKLTVTNAAGCSDSDSVFITVNPLPLVTLRNDTSICESDSVSIDAGNVGSDFVWNTLETSQEITVKTAGMYHVLVTDGNGCEGRDTMNLIVNPNPVPDLGPDQALCVPNTFTVDAGSWATYLWHDGTTDPTLLVNTTTKAYVDITDANACKGSDTILVTINPLPVVDLGPDLERCQGETAELDAENLGASCLWNTSATTQTLVIDATGTYGLVVTDGNGCQGSDSMDLVVHPLPILNLGNDTTICDGQSVTVNAGTWSSILWGDGQTTEAVTINTTATAYADIVDGNGCKGVDTINVTVNPIPVVDLGPDSTICVGESITLDAGNPGLNFLWSTGAVTQTIQGTEGPYEVTVSDEIGCAMKDEVVISNEVIEDPFIKKEYEFCEGESAELWADNNINNYLISWPGQSLAPTLTVSGSGTYTSLVKGQYCEASFDLTSIKIDTPDVYIARTSLMEVVCFETDVMELSVLGDNVDAYEYLWSTGDVETSIEITQPGEYYVDADNQGCPSKALIQVEEFCPGKLFIPNAFSPNSDGKNEVWSPKGYNVYDYQMRIFDRWGLLLYTSESLENGWDGKYLGRGVQQDVYIYKISYTYDLMSGEPENKNKVGTVTLIR